jgi:hypothetical protein
LRAETVTTQYFYRDVGRQQTLATDSLASCSDHWHSLRLLRLMPVVVVPLEAGDFPAASSGADYKNLSVIQKGTDQLE